MAIFKKLIPLYLFLFFIFLSNNTIVAKEGRDRKGIVNIGDKFANQRLLAPIFEKLYNLEQSKQGKINIVHVGDSHIQADFFTNTIREVLQNKFGNGGYGFTFPYSLVKTNGTPFVRYASNATWQSLLNVYPIADVGIGLSGIALYTSAQNFVVQLSAMSGYEFNTVKIIYPDEESHYKICTSAEPLEIAGRNTSVSSKSTVRIHKVKKGETLAAISRRYGVSAVQIKRASRMRSNVVKPGQTLNIPVKSNIRTVQAKADASNLDESDMNFVDLVSKPYYSSYKSDTVMNRITIMPDGKRAMYNLNGFVIENDKPGIIYHTIGVNGAKISDYNKYPLFFKQLPILQPDLIILSFGTNESFGKLSDTEYLYKLNEFVNNIKLINRNAIVLVMTPPPSMFRRRQPNTYIADYSVALTGISYLPVWDLYSRMGGESGIEPDGEYSDMIARDMVHYTSRGYEAQGLLFASDFIEAYNSYKKYKRN